MPYINLPSFLSFVVELDEAKMFHLLWHRLVKVNQEIGMIEAANENEPIDFTKYPIGMMLSIIPYHVSYIYLLFLYSYFIL